VSRVVDMWAPILPTPEIVKHLEHSFAEEMLGYLRVFYKLSAKPEGVGDFLARLGGGLKDEQILGALDAAGIERVLVTGFDEYKSVGKTFVPNEIVADQAARLEGRVLPFAGADVLRGMPAVRELESLVREQGFRGLSLRPFMIGLPADERRYYPFYAKCCELGIPVSIHASANWTEVRSSDLGHPRHFDTVACDFPELKLILSHGGYPWVLEAVLLAWKHPNVYLELAAHRPKYLAQPGTGWEPLLRFGTTTIRDKVLFGTGSFLLGRAPAEVTEEFRQLPLPADVLDLWMHGNAARLLDL
jgi:uncharacterized protein